MKHLATFLFLSCGRFAQAAVAQSPDEPEANPGRPTVSTPATLTPVGHLQFETGFTGTGDSPEFSSRYALVAFTGGLIGPHLRTHLNP